MFFYLSLLLSLSLAQSQPNQAAPRSDVLLAEINARLTAYEARVQAGGEDRKELEQIARLALASAQASTQFDAWSQACLSTFARRPDADCERRLRDTAQQGDLPVARRAAAASILVRNRAAGATDLLLSLVKGLNPKSLASVAPYIATLPEPTAVPLLVRALSSESPADRATVCKSLGTMGGPESRRALGNAVASMPSGTPEWLACTVARGRLNEPDATWKLQGISNYMSGEDLLDAADAMIATGNQEAALYAVQKVVRQGSPSDRLSAAQRLATLEPDAARPVVDQALKERDPATRASALTVERLLRRPPSALVRSQLGDPEALVRLRAAEAVLSAVSDVK